MQYIRKTFETKSGVKGSIVIERKSRFEKVLRGAKLFLGGSVLLGLVTFGGWELSERYLGNKPAQQVKVGKQISLNIPYKYELDYEHNSVYIIIPSKDNPSRVVDKLAKHPNKCFIRLSERKSYIGKRFPIGNGKFIETDRDSYVIEIPLSELNF
jgi:hypothetical protein